MSTPATNSNTVQLHVSCPVAAVGSWLNEDAEFQSMSLAALGNGSFLGDEGDESVSAPFKSCHLWWQGAIMGSAKPLLITVSMLIDNSAHVVLIDSDLVLKLGLQCH